MSTPPRAQWRWYVVLLIVLVVSLSYAGAHLMRGWVPHDEGSFAQSADRVMHGEMPHRDYAEIYTGGLAYLNATAFRYLGENFATLRVVLFAFFVLWVPTFYWIASRLVSDWVAGGATLLAVAWSLPNYSAAVPSWYNLFFATFGLAAIWMYLAKNSTLWLFLAGLSGGLSFLAKNGALFYVAAVLLFILFREQELSRSTTRGPEGRSVAYSAFLGLSMMVFSSLLVFLIRPHASAERLLEFVAPSAALAAVVLVREANGARAPSRQRFAMLASMCVPFLLGFLVPVLFFFLLYVRGGWQGAFLRGVFVAPFRRVSGAFMDPPRIISTASPLCLACLFGLACRWRGVARWILVSLAAAGAAYCLVASAYDEASYRAVWHAAYWAMPLLSATGAYLLWPRIGEMQADSVARQKLFVILALGSVCGLIQYPFSAPIYFCYVAPLVILAGVATLSSIPSVPKALHGVMFACFLLFAVLRVTPPFIYAMGQHYGPDPETQPLQLPRASNLKVEPQSAENYARLIRFIQEHAGAGGIYAGPDCPEVYFLSGYANPTRALFEFLEEDEQGPDQLLRMITSERIQVVILNTAPSFSAVRVSAEVRVILARRFPRSLKIGQFVVFWHD